MASISSTAYDTLQTCRRLYYWQNVRHVEKIKIEGAREFGTLYHLGLEAWWKTAGQGDVPWATVDMDTPLVLALGAIDGGSKHMETDPYEAAKARAMMVAYHARWAELQFERVGEGVESYFRVPLKDPDGHEVPGWFMAGKKDAFIKLESRPFVTPVEHKTTTSDIAPSSAYDQRLVIDGQISTYIDAANALGHSCNEALYDMSRKPSISPERATPEDRREMTLGKGCKECGGTAVTKDGVPPQKGTGIVMIPDPTFVVEEEAEPKKRGKKKEHDGPKIEAPCEPCNGSGWKEAPKYKANVRLTDEPPQEFGWRIGEAISKNPEAYLRHAFIPRSEEQIKEARADLVAATIEIDQLYARMRKETGTTEHPRSRFVWPRKTTACMNIYGRICDFLPVCSGQIKEPLESQLYQIRNKVQATGAKS